MRFLQTLLVAAMALPLPALATIRIMPFGDSITGTPGCWRALIWQQLKADGFTDLDFVGSLPSPACGIEHDGDNEGHAGFQAKDIADKNQLVDWLAKGKPDIVLMHLGTNDIVWQSAAPNVITTAFSKLIDQMRASNPKMKIVVSQIIPMAASFNGDAAIKALNAAIPAWAESKTTAESPIVVVDQYTGFVADTDTADGVHPNPSGDKKIAARYYPALVAYLKELIDGPSNATVAATQPARYPPRLR